MLFSSPYTFVLSPDYLPSYRYEETPFAVSGMKVVIHLRLYNKTAEEVGLVLIGLLFCWNNRCNL